IVWLAALAVGWSGAFLFYSARARREAGVKWAPNISARIRTAVAVTIVVLAIAYAGQRTYTRILWRRATSAQTAEELDVLYNRFGVRYDPAVLIAIADNRSSSMELLQKLSTNEHWLVRTVVARNPKTEPEVLRRMYEDHSARTSLAANPNTPLDVLERLLHDSDPMVQNNLAYNGSVTDAMLVVLAKNSSKYVSRQARTQQTSRAFRKRRGCLDRPKPIPVVRHEGPLPTLDEVVEAHRRQTGLDYQVCPDGYDYRLDNAEVRAEHRACIAEARKACTPTEYRMFGTPNDPGFITFATFIEPRDDGRCGTVVITDAREAPSVTRSGCRIMKETDCQVVDLWGCPSR
ncbi:MAG: hypothetical protein KJN97_02635, partial [Deltaproteobacteria bacterium]|nr:hypothetical protein [Deltaproteobacteria bacterium]